MPNGNDSFCYGAFSKDELVAEAEHRKEGLALTLLVNLVYRLQENDDGSLETGLGPKT